MPHREPKSEKRVGKNGHGFGVEKQLFGRLKQVRPGSFR